MKKISCLAILFAGLIAMPCIASAQPHHNNGAPRECTNHHGQLDCHKPGCERFCHADPRDHRGPGPGPGPAADRHPAPAPHHHPAPAPKPQPNHIAPPPPPPAPGPHAMNHHRNDQIERQIRELVAENNRLEDEKRRAIHEADIAYAYCVNLPHAVRMFCTRPDSEIRDIDNRINRNRHEIERLKRMQR